MAVLRRPGMGVTVGVLLMFAGAAADDGGADQPSPAQRLVNLRQARREARTKTELTELVTDALDLSRDALSADTDGERTALQAISFASTIAAATGNKHLVAVCSRKQGEVQAIARETRNISRTLRNVDAGAADAEQATSAGKFYGLLLDDWETAVPLLQQSEDSTVRQVAALEASVPERSELQMELAAAWAAIADGEAGILQARAFERSHHWFRQALSQASGERAEEIRSGMDVLPFRYVTDLTPSDSEPGPYGLGRYGATGWGVRIEINGLEYALGLGEHPHDSGFASVTYDLNGEYDSLFLGAALNDSGVKFRGKEIVFRVIGDRKPLWSTSITERGVADAASIDVSGIDRLELRTEAPGSYFGGHAVWLDPVLIK